MLGLRLTTDAQARWKNGSPAQRTTGTAQASWTQFDAARLSGTAPAPPIISAIASPNTGNPTTAPTQARRVMSASSGFGGSSAVAAPGTSGTSGCRAIPHFGQGTGSVSRTSGHIGQT